MNPENELTLKVRRGTGSLDTAYIAASKFYIVYPDGKESHIWSGPWNDYQPEEEIAGALLEAAKRHAAKFTQLAKDQNLPVEKYKEQDPGFSQVETVMP